jgi:hypothetical protein
MRAMPVLILGFSGSGKSTSMRNLDPEETFLINCGDKILPFKNGPTLYTEYNKESNPNGNMITTDNYPEITKFMKGISEQKKSINNIVIDDSQALIINEFMAKHKANNKGNEVFALYNDIAYNFYNLLRTSKTLRDDLLIFFLHHAELTDNGMIQPKTIGKLLNDKIDIPSNFTVVLFAIREGKQNYFLTQNDGTTPTKTPEGMFTEDKINNCLQNVRESIITYFKGNKND